MKRKRLIFGAVTVLIVILLAVILGPNGSDDMSKVNIGFNGYEVIEDGYSLRLTVTNGSAHQITRPSGDYELTGRKTNGVTYSGGTISISCGFAVTVWGWWQFELPRIKGISPGGVFQFTVPVSDPGYEWCVAVPLQTIPFARRLPYVLREHWPVSARSEPILFEVTSSPIPPEIISLGEISSGLGFMIEEDDSQ